ncbi:hypothetical protein AJ78_02730 [Emergomyces pasteurianus Ep9510]|uniref:Uncharacterized protein n=1 Tax=Emergomyces pasteurianus Ep9510 TaxID=1447872 RepID=A0A1J9PKV3_9EURO|nr:hypothetical protein AJ78_02730 [Emergomyces pasteurianus Ep9510]
MGNKVSAVTGVRSPNFFEPGNAVNEVWVGDFEVVSRLPFGDSDMAQAAWPKNDYPKIPWRPFIIPLRATVSAVMKSRSFSSIADPDSGWAVSIRTFADTELLLICWVVIQILAIPVLMVPIALHLVTHDHLAACDDDGDGDDDDGSPPDPSAPLTRREVQSSKYCQGKRTKAAFARSLLGSVFHVTGVLLVYGMGHGPVLNSIRFPQLLAELRDSNSFTGLDSFTIYAAMSTALVLNSAYSVLRLWCAYYKSRRDQENEEA